MKLHRPAFMVSKNNATRKLFKAIENNNEESAWRQLKRGANITAKMKNNSGKNINIYNLVNRKYPNYYPYTSQYMTGNQANKRENVLNFLRAAKFNVNAREKARIEAINKERAENQEKIFNKMQKEREQREREHTINLIKQQRGEQERLRPMVMARKKLYNLNRAMTYKNGKPVGLSIKIPKNKSRKVTFNK